MMTPSNRSSVLQAQLDERKGRLLVEIREDVTSTQVPELRQAMMHVLEEHGFDSWKALYMDVRNARMIDSMGTNWLFAESVRLKEHKKSLVLRISSPAIHRVLQFAGLDKLVTVKFRRRKQTR